MNNPINIINNIQDCINEAVEEAKKDYYPDMNKIHLELSCAYGCLETLKDILKEKNN